jgi:hypothetical protein
MMDELIEAEEILDKSFNMLVERLRRYRDFLWGMEKGIEEWLPSNGLVYKDHPLLPVLHGLRRVIKDIDEVIEVYSE